MNMKIIQLILTGGRLSSLDFDDPIEKGLYFPSKKKSNLVEVHVVI